MKIVATKSLPAIDHPNADRWNADRSRQFYKSILEQCAVVWQVACHQKDIKGFERAQKTVEKIALKTLNLDSLDDRKKIFKQLAQ